MQRAFGKSPFPPGPLDKGESRSPRLSWSLPSVSSWLGGAGAGAGAGPILPPAGQTQLSTSCTQQAGLGFSGPGVRVQSRVSGPRAPVPF